MEARSGSDCLVAGVGMVRAVFRLTAAPCRLLEAAADSGQQREALPRKTLFGVFLFP